MAVRRLGKIQFRRGTAAEWTSANTVLTAGELGYETDTGKGKIGDGTTAWTALSYTWTASDAVGGKSGLTQNKLLKADTDGNAVNSIITDDGNVASVNGDLQIDNDKHFYLRGNASTNGSVRMSYQSADDTFKIEKRESGSWVEKHSFLM